MRSEKELGKPPVRTIRFTVPPLWGSRSKQNKSSGVIARRCKDSRAAGIEEKLLTTVEYAGGRGKTLKLNSSKAPNPPKVPTVILGISKPAAFFTTFPPARTSRPLPSLYWTPSTKARK